MEIRNSREDYLEAILVMAQKAPQVRSVDVAEHLGYSKASVSRAMAQLVEAGLVHMDRSKLLTLTEQGLQEACRVYEKHRFFEEMLLSAGVEEHAAAEEACRIEHAISDEAFRAIKATYGEDGLPKSDTP
ncbi:MAG: metal-dependent transcriptional regulator [Ruminococcaceae bacterium]|nr:metal-dependent transcriptional regulator [Oscillospiraceae bacterium]